ncbi:MAG: hypothetical protein ACO1OB_02025 [Archangium sp.]
MFTGVRLENTTQLTLEGGTLSVFADGAYSGETQIDRVKPGEVRVLRHGEDLDLEVVRSQRREEGDPRKVRIVGSEGSRALEVTRVDKLVHRVEFTSRTDAVRTVLVELAEARYRVTAGGDEDVRSPNQPRYGRITVEPRASKTVDLVEEGAVVERIPATSLTSQRLTALLGHTLPDDARSLLVSLRNEILRAEQAQQRLATLDAELRQLEADIARTRENLAAVGKTATPDVARKLGQKLLALEESLVKLRGDRQTTAETDTNIRRVLLSAR